MYNSQYYTCEQIDQRLLQGYLDDYNTQNNTNLTKAEFLTLIFNTVSRNNIVDNLVTQIGYYECDTAAGTAAKAITVANYNLFAGGSMKVKFVNKNTANNVTLNINSQGAKALYYQGEMASSTNSWDEGEVVEIYYDGTNYYANNVKGGSGSGVYDVSVEHPTSGPNGDGKFTLEYILNSSNVNELIPINKRYHGMSIQFVSIYDNKYVQARCMAQNFTTDVNQWQGVDDEITEGSHNLAESGGVSQYVFKNAACTTIPVNIAGKLVSYSDGSIISSSAYNCVAIIPVKTGDILVIHSSLTNTSFAIVAMYNGDTYVKASSVQAGMATSAYDETITVPAGVTKVIVGCTYINFTNAYVKLYSKQLTEYVENYVNDSIQESSSKKEILTTESGCYNAVVGSEISKATQPQAIRTDLIDVENLSKVIVFYDNGNSPGSSSLNFPCVILTDKNRIVLYANNTFINNSEIDLSLYPTVKYLALVQLNTHTDIGFICNKDEKINQEIKNTQSALKSTSEAINEEIDQLEQKIGVTYTEFPSAGWINYDTGERKTGASGFRYLELNVNEGEKYRIFTSVSYNLAAVIAMYNGDTYVKESSTAHSTVDTTITIPTGITRMIVAAQFSTWTEGYYVALESSFASKSIEANVASLEDEVSAINTRTFNSPFSVSKRYVLYATGGLTAGTDAFKYEEFDVKEGDFIRVFTKITPTTAAVIAAYNGDTYVQSASIKTNSQERTIDYVVPAGVNKLRVSAQYDLGTEQYYVKTCRYALYSDTVFTKQDDGYYGNFPKYQDFVVGRQSILYLNNIGRKYEDTLNEFYTSQSGYAPTGYYGSPLAISYSPTATGSTDITFIKKRNISDTLASKKITFRAVSKNTGSGETKNIIFIGDSLIASGDASEQVYNMLVEDADYTINMLGDHGDGNKVNAGHGSWSWADWINPAGESTAIYGMLNPFMHNGELDFTNFMSVNYPALSGIDIAVISLGTNDMGQGAGGISSAQNAVANAKVFIDALLADYPNVKIALGIPSCGAYSAGATGFAHYPQGFRNSILLYAKEMIDTFDNGAYHANVTCVFHGWFIDPDNDYPNNEITLPSGVKTKCVTNFIHPSTIGYQHWGVGYYNKIRAILSGVL